MTPLLLLALLATPTTPPATINPPTTHHQEAPTTKAHPNNSNPERHPSSGPMRGPGTTFQRIGRDASNPSQQHSSSGYPTPSGNTIHGRGLTPTEHTSRGK